MTYLKQLLERLTPTLVASLLTTVLAALFAFGVELTLGEQASVVAFGSALAVVVLGGYISAPTVLGLAAAAIQVAVQFGVPITAAQNESILQLTGLLAGILVVHVAKSTVSISRKRPTSPPVRYESTMTHESAKTTAGNACVRIAQVPRFKTGRRPPKNAPALLLQDILTGVIPAHPATADHFAKLAFGLYGNDKFGVCGPTSVANLVRLITGGLLGAEITPSQEDVYDLYRRSGNPNFNPVTGEDDNGVDMQTMLEALLAGGIGDGKGGKVKPVAFAKVNVTDDAELEAAVSIFGGVLWGVNLETAQQAQTNAIPPEWDYHRSGVWGGHAVLNGAYESGQLEDVISWATRVETTETFRSHQLEEAWVVVFEWHLDNPAFQAGVDLVALSAAYEALTGRVLPIPAPTPVPGPTPTASAADRALWAGVGAWAQGRHSRTTLPVAMKLVAWAKAIGLD